MRAIRVKPRYPFGTHHTKMMILEYEDDSLRVVVHTANLIGSDWTNRTQGLWVSPRCPALPEGSPDSEGESKTFFKTSLLRYLKFYELSPLKSYVEAVKRADFGEVNAFFIASVPGSHRGPDLNFWGHKALSGRLRQNVREKVDNWPVVIQCSSIGSLGQNENLWFKGEFGQSLAATSNMGQSQLNVKMIYPSKKNVLESYDAILGGGCLPYSGRTAEKQPWLEKYFCSWQASSTHRQRAMPHIKTYCRYDPDYEKAAYFLLTSANLSKAAWGSMTKNKDSIMIMSYEAGVLLLPKFVTGKTHFEVGKEFNPPYDVPPVKYGQNEEVWLYDYLRAALAS